MKLIKNISEFYISGHNKFKKKVFYLFIISPLIIIFFLYFLNIKFDKTFLETLNLYSFNLIGFLLTIFSIVYFLNDYNLKTTSRNIKNINEEYKINKTDAEYLVFNILIISILIFSSTLLNIIFFNHLNVIFQCIFYNIIVFMSCYFVIFFYYLLNSLYNLIELKQKLKNKS